MVTIREIAWAAAIYEGEGNFSGTQALVVQKDPWVLHKLQEIFKFGSIRPHNDNCYHWGVSGQNARQFLLTIFTLLSPRRKAEILQHKTFFADAMFNRQTICRNGHIKTVENTMFKRTSKNRGRKLQLICLDCRADRKLG
jgi:hypothetical protein